MMKDLIEECYQGETEEELGYIKYNYHNKDTDNSRNGYSSKTLKTITGEMDVSIPRDRNGNYEPQLIKKHQNTIGQDLEAKIISMYAKGMTTNSIEGFNRQLRKVTKSKTIFPTDDSLLKMLYLATVDITKKWTSKYREWGHILSQFQIYFEDRI